MIEWVSTKKNLVSHSSYGTKMVAYKEVDDRGYYVKQALKSIKNEEKYLTYYT